jgi:preprotein translocase subunit YajC
MRKCDKVRQGSGRRAVRAAAMLTGSAVMALGGLTGCISVSAPDKPIVIELNINIKQEIVYRLSADAANTIDKNPGIF